jgi:glycosyltransferase involved in cell wall biosynthesis
VLATPVGAIPEIMDRFEPQWLAQNESADAIAQLLIDFLKGEFPAHDPESLRQKVAEYYSKDRVLRQLVKVIVCE